MNGQQWKTSAAVCWQTGRPTPHLVSSPQMAFLPPPWLALAGATRPKNAGSFGSRWHLMLMPDEICPGSSPESHGVCSKRRQGCSCTDKVDFGSTVAPWGGGEGGTGKREGAGKAVAWEWTIRRISLAFLKSPLEFQEATWSWRWRHIPKSVAQKCRERFLCVGRLGMFLARYVVGPQSWIKAI